MNFEHFNVEFLEINFEYAYSGFVDVLIKIKNDKEYNTTEHNNEITHYLMVNYIIELLTHTFRD